MKILLDPLIYWITDEDDKCEKLKYWNKITDIIEHYFDIQYVCSDSMIRTLCRLNREPSGLGREYNALKQQLIKRMFSNLDYANRLDETSCSIYDLPQEFQLTGDEFIDASFLKLLSCITLTDEECIILLSLDNHKCEKIKDRNIFVVKHISGEVNSKITELMKDRLYLKKNVKMPTLAAPLPSKDLCDNFLVLQNDLEKHNSKISVILKITREVALRNFYTYDSVVTNKNTTGKHKRKIYTYQKIVYLSTDFESGCFEVHNSSGKHEGEYSYVGKLLSPADKSGRHDIQI